MVDMPLSLMMPTVMSHFKRASFRHTRNLDEITFSIIHALISISYPLSQVQRLEYVKFSRFCYREVHGTRVCGDWLVGQGIDSKLEVVPSMLGGVSWGDGTSPEQFHWAIPQTEWARLNFKGFESASCCCFCKIANEHGQKLSKFCNQMWSIAPPAKATVFILYPKHIHLTFSPMFTWEVTWEGKKRGSDWSFNPKTTGNPRKQRKEPFLRWVHTICNWCHLLTGSDDESK